MKRTVMEYHYDGRKIGRVVDFGDGREFQTNLTSTDAMDILSGMSPSDKVHMKSRAYGVLKLAQYFEIRAESYLTDEDLAIHIMDLGCRNLTELAHRDHRAWQLLHDRGLAKRFFKDLTESD